MLFTPADYAELVGLYIGDGHITQMARAQRLRLNARRDVSVIVDECRRSDRESRAVQQRRPPVPARGPYGRAVHRHWSCLLPQHGPGKKHERRIVLEPWQEALVHAAPWAFLRGRVRSGGCVFMNRTGKYAYESYDFTSFSRDILELFVATCAQVSVACRVYDKHTRIYRRSSVALMLEHVARTV